MTTKQLTPAESRKRAGRYTIRDVAEEIGVTYKTLYWRVVQGLIKRPSTRLGRHQRRYYTQIDLEAIRDYFQGGQSCEEISQPRRANDQ